MVGGQIHEKVAGAAVDRRDQFAELVQRRGARVELRQRGIDREKIERRKGRAVAPHARVGDGRGVDGQKLHDAEAERSHDVVQLAGHVAEGARGRNHGVAQLVQLALLVANRVGARVAVQRRAELAHERAVHRVRTRRVGGLDFDAQVVALRPFGDVGALGEEAGLARKNADLCERDAHGEKARARRAHRHIVPVARQSRLAGFGAGDDLLAADVSHAQIGAEDGSALARRVEAQRDFEEVARPFQVKTAGMWSVLHKEKAV